METMTIQDMNERAYAAFADRFDNSARKLHGILAPCARPGMIQLLWPYGQVLAAIRVHEGSRCDNVFDKGALSLSSFLSCLIRACQLLGLSVHRLEQKMEKDRRDLETHIGEESWTTEIDLEADYGEFHSTSDVIIHIDSCISYLKILADGVAKTMPSLFGNRLNNSRDSINKLWNDSINSQSCQLQRVFSTTSRDWLDVLSTAKTRIAGIRDARFHHGAWISPSGYAEGDRQFQLLIQMRSSKEKEIDIQTGEDCRKSVAHSTDLLSDFTTSASGFFSFLDTVVREAISQNPVLSPIQNSYSKSGYVLGYGPSEFISSMFPAV